MGIRAHHSTLLTWSEVRADVELCQAPTSPELLLSQVCHHIMARWRGVEEMNDLVFGNCGHSRVSAVRMNGSAGATDSLKLMEGLMASFGLAGSREGRKGSPAEGGLHTCGWSGGRRRASDMKWHMKRKKLWPLNTPPKQIFDVNLLKLKSHFDTRCTHLLL